MTYINLPLLFFTVFFTASSYAITEISTQTLLNKTITKENIYRDLAFLSDDNLKGRANFSSELNQAAQYIAERMMAIGLTPVNAVNIKNIKSTSQGNCLLRACSIAPTDFFQSFNIAKKQLVTSHLAKTLKNKDISIPLHNVVGILPGTSKANEVIIFSAHYDHLGQTIQPSLPKGSDNIFNGADDNASGVTAILQLAEYYQRYYQHTPNKRTIMFVAFAAEELGGLGSKYFGQQTNPKNIMAMINIEMIGKVSRFGKGSFWLTGYEYSTLGEKVNQHLLQTSSRLQPIWKIHPDPYPKYNLFYRSDNASLAKLGVPAHTISASQIDKDKHYHQPSDELNTLDITSIKLVLHRIAHIGNFLIDDEITPSRITTKP